MTDQHQVRLDIIRALLRHRADGSGAGDPGLANIVVCDDWHGGADDQAQPRPPQPRSP